MHNVDEVLGDLGLNINPINPAAYRNVTPKFLERLASASAEPAPRTTSTQPPQLSSSTDGPASTTFAAEEVTGQDQTHTQPGHAPTPAPVIDPIRRLG